MASDELGRRVHHDVRSPIERPAEVRSGEGVVDHERRAVIVGDFRHRLDVEDVPSGISDGLGVEELGVLLEGALPGGEVVGVDEGELDRELPEVVLELVHRAAVEGARGDDVIAGLEESEESSRLRGDTAREGDSSDAAFEIRHSLFERRHRRVHDAGVGVPVLFEIEVGRGRFRVLEDVARRLEDGNGAGAGVGIRPLARVHLPGVEAKGACVFHCRHCRLQACFRHLKTSCSLAGPGKRGRENRESSGSAAPPREGTSRDRRAPR